MQRKKEKKNLPVRPSKRLTDGRQAHKAGKQLVVLEAEKDGEGFKLSFVSAGGHKNVMRRYIDADQFIGFEKLFRK